MAAGKGDGLAGNDAGMASPVVVRDATPDADVSLLFTRFRRQGLIGEYRDVLK